MTVYWVYLRRRLCDHFVICVYVTHLSIPCGGAGYGATGAMIASIGRPVPVSLADACQYSRYSFLSSRLCLCTCHSSYVVRHSPPLVPQFGISPILLGFGQAGCSPGCGIIVFMTGSPVGAVHARKSSPPSAV